MEVSSEKVIFVIGKIDRLIYGGIVNVISKIRNDYTAVKFGDVLKSKKRIDNTKEYAGLIAKSVDSFGPILLTTRDVMEYLDRIKNSNGETNIEPQIEFVLNGYYEFLSDFYRRWENFYFSTCPQGFFKIEEGVHVVYDKLFSCLFSWSLIIENMLNDPKKYASDDGTINLFFSPGDFGKEMNMLIEEMNRVAVEARISKLKEVEI